MHAAARDYPWAEELEKTVVTSLATSFGLDFLLFQDKHGGEVDTIHNARNGVWATEQEKQRFEKRGDYNPDPYHQHENYIETGRRDKATHLAGELHDPYRNTTLTAAQKRNLDHVISAKEIHDDAGRVLAGLDGVELANQSSNLQTTHESINKSKGQTPINDYLRDLPELIGRSETKLAKDRARLASLPRDTPEQQHNARVLEDQIRKDENKIETLKAIDPDEMRKRDEAARAPYNEQINRAYYTSSKFWKQSASASLDAGLKMGARQMLGLVLAEVWFELRGQVPTLLEKLKHKFDFETFIDSVNSTLKGIWTRVQKRFTDFLIGFKDGVFAGVMASATTTLFNVFATTKVMAVKIIREVWGQLVKAIKLMIFNPEQLGFVDLCKAVTSLMSLGAATVVGTMVHAQLLPLCSFPFGGELVAFASALVTGVVTLGLNYFLLHSPVAHKLWAFIESIMPHAGVVKHFESVNAELDRYLTELGKLEFNLDADELEAFSLTLMACNDELQRGMVLKAEVVKRNIELPFEMGNSASTRDWLASLV
ncbi:MULTISPECIES: hypothetical protein [Pseudomonas]|uniref:hypothetical protein n=1 Tax=Pseudomonas TaxID=286 RepID=UPI0007C6FC9A|nr:MULTISPECIES: hypothetical protein [Pseudomonas]GLO44056.1 hypothetical protein PPUN109347_06180 [Pseudomonas putida]HDS0979641.1 DNA repair protein [Pseudomonas putida]